MSKFLKHILALLVIAGVPWGAAVAAESDQATLLMAYIRLSLAQEIRAQMIALSDSIPEPMEQQIQVIAEEWFLDEVTDLRQRLQQRFGDTARNRFQDFVSEYTSAESENDAEFLRSLSIQTGLMETARDYPALRRLALDRWLSKPLSEGARLLSEIQTWMELNNTQSDIPALDSWLARLEDSPADPASPGGLAGRLAAAEAPVQPWSAATGRPAETPLLSFVNRRRQRREAALQRAQAGMQQVAIERQAAEQEYAAKMTAKAQTDADALKLQAAKLAAVEADALSQRENSWGNRIKRILGSTISAGVGAFTGGIGVVAGQRAVEEIFR